MSVLLVLLGIDGHRVSTRGIGGITRLQKLLFLIWKDAGIQEVEKYFEFECHEAGPLSRRLYDELESLENLGLIQSEACGRAVEAEAIELQELAFGHLADNDRFEMTASDCFEERRFTLTDRGLKSVKQMLEKPEFTPFADGIRKIKSKFANYSLQDLLYPVYTKYGADGWIPDSMIVDDVLRKGMLR